MYVGICLEFYVTVTCSARGGSFQSVWESLVSYMDHKTLERDFIFLLSRLQKSDKFEPETLK